MAKKKFVERRRRMADAENRSFIDAHGCRDSITELLQSLGVEFETHWSEDEDDDYDGFVLSWEYDTDRMWYVVKNPHGCGLLELAIDYGFDVLFGGAGWSFHPTISGYENFREMITAIVNGNASAVRCLIDGEDVAHAILVGDLMNEYDMRLLERIAERDYYGTNQDTDYTDNFNASIELKKKLRELRSRNGWTAAYEFWDPRLNKVVEFRKILDQSMLH